ncbi:MAG: 1-acyl-sn-glycerol-3-phosphate acyltransferase [Proteobacteria bacterium]|nr:1-acyl-sn-glycerol-3-phosphate acyltransferase [Pseudomonadota bacterium]
MPRVSLLMINTILVVAWIVIATIIFGLAAVFTGFFSKTGNIPHLVAVLWARTILFVSRVKVKTQGVHRLDPEKSYIFMANHLSNFDIPALFVGLPVQFRWLAKAELFKIPIFGQGMKGCGYISIDRSNRESAFGSLREAANKIQSGVSVMIFPEGTRSHDGKLLPFKKGGFVLAQNAGVPIVPVTIKGSGVVMSRNEMRIKAGEIHIEILPEIDTLAFADQNKDVLMEAVRCQLEAALKDSEGVTL